VSSSLSFSLSIFLFAAKLSIDEESATSLISEVVPNIVDSSSSAGSLLDSIGGIEGAMGMLKKFF